MQLNIEIQQLSEELEKLASFTDAPYPAVTRIVFSDQDRRAREWLKRICGDADLDVREDAVGNLFARWEGSEPALPAVGTGSHIDAIPHSGRYDGTVGVLGGLEAIRALKDAGFQPRRSIELLMFTSEEPTRFGIGCLGSRILSGALDPSVDDTYFDSEGHSLREVRTTAGFKGELASAHLPADYYSAFVELHIEQGPLLELREVPIGVVTAIAAPASVRVFVDGQGGHAGAVLMPDRHDAFMAAAEIALAVEAAARSTGAIDSVATTGICELFPAAVNSIPSNVTMAMDIRDIDEVRRDAMLRSLERSCKDVSARRGVTARTEIINCDAPAKCHDAVVSALQGACGTHELAFDLMVSRAYHDSLFMSRVCPTAMVFIPCKNGVSHRPEEYAAPEAIQRGVTILAEALATLAGQSSPTIGL